MDELQNKSAEKNRFFDEEAFHTFSKLFTRINYFRRGESNKPFERIGFILMTNNSFAKYLARNNSVKFGDYDIPFAEDIDFITSTFWFKLKKGFSNGLTLPKSSDVVSKAKIILSAHLENKVSQRFQELKQNYQTGKLHKDEAIERNSVFREKAIRPEEITSQNVNDSLDFLLNDEEYIENIKREQSNKDELLKEQQIKIQDLENEKEREIIRLQNEIQQRDDAKKRELQLKQSQELEQEKEEYIEARWKEEKQKNNKDLGYFLVIFAMNLYLAVIVVFLLSQDFRNWLFTLGFWQSVILVTYPIIILIEILGRSYLFDKDRFKNGWKWFITTISDKHFETEFKFKELSEKDFLDKRK